jgi:hypothetical protein
MGRGRDFGLNDYMPLKQPSSHTELWPRDRGSDIIFILM